MSRGLQKDKNTLDKVEGKAEVEGCVISCWCRGHLMLQIALRQLNLAAAPAEKATNCGQQHWIHGEKVYCRQKGPTSIVKLTLVASANRVEKAL